MDALQYVKDLVAFESTSLLSNAPISDYVDEMLKKLGFQTERIEYDDVNGIRKVSVVGKKGGRNRWAGLFRSHRRCAGRSLVHRRTRDRLHRPSKATGCMVAAVAT